MGLRPGGRSRVALIIGVVVTTLAILVAPAAADAKSGPKRPAISVLSGRADLVSDGDALVAIDLRRGRDTQHVKVTVKSKAGKRKVATSAFERAGKRRLVGLVTHLRVGKNTLAATLPDGSGAKLALINHPRGGPVLAGPQLRSWTCQPTAVDAQCNQPTQFIYLYRSTDPTKSDLQPYDPANPPGDVASTTTDAGVEVPFIVRLEVGYMDRDQYQVAALYQPGQPWTASEPQEQFNHKMLIFHGAGCGVDYKTGGAPSVKTGVGIEALGRGFITMSTALDNAGHNCNLALEAESLLMAKEHVVDSYGTLRYTIGTGCSGGSLAQQWIANAYPGIYQGILPTCSFPDAWSTATQFLDYHLLLAYFNDSARWGPGVVWTEPQMANVEGHISIANSQVSDSAQFHVVVPTDPCAGTTDADRYNPVTNPAGTRCSVLDAAINVFGPRPPKVWSPAEKQIGHGFAGIPVDNVGVQYGLKALESGQITPAQFADLNASIGGIDIDTNLVSNRLEADRSALANAYRSGMINETNNLNKTAIIDCRGPDPGLFHDAYRAFAVRARLDREHGTHANQLIWEGPATIVGDSQCELNSFLAMDRWLAAVEADRSHKPLARKIAADKPDDLADRCYDGAGHMLSSGLCPDPVVPIYGTPRTVAGDPITTDTNKCRLKPLSRDDYGVAFTDAQWQELEATFPNGVCDFSRSGVKQQVTIPWQTYQRKNSKVIYGGRPLGAPPKSRVIG